MALYLLRLALTLMIFSHLTIAEDQTKDNSPKRLSFEDMLAVPEQIEKKKDNNKPYVYPVQNIKTAEHPSVEKKIVEKEPNYSPETVEFSENEAFNLVIPAMTTVKGTLMSPVSSEYSGVGSVKVRVDYSNEDIGNSTFYLIGKYFVIKDTNRVQIQFNSIQQGGKLKTARAYAMDLSDELPGVIGKVNRRPVKRLSIIANTIIEKKFIDLTSNDNIDAIAPKDSAQLPLETHNIVSLVKGHPILVFVEQPLKVESEI